MCGCLNCRQLDRAHLCQWPSCVLSTTPKRVLPINTRADGATHLPSKPDPTHSNTRMLAAHLLYGRVHAQMQCSRWCYMLILSFLTHILGVGGTRIERWTTSTHAHTHTHALTHSFSLFMILSSSSSSTSQLSAVLSALIIRCGAPGESVGLQTSHSVKLQEPDYPVFPLLGCFLEVVCCTELKLLQTHTGIFKS